MCGFVGYVNFLIKNVRSSEVLQRANTSIQHRGPDEGDIFNNEYVGFGHRRLSIIDLHSGKQPIFNEDNTIVVVFNGELFNYKTLREELILKGHKFRTNSDTETIVHLYEEKGKEFVHFLEGMFSIAIYDISKKEVILARDRYGIKPLYFYIDDDNSISFASEIKAILKLNDLELELDEFYTKEFLCNRFVKHPNTVYKNIMKLPPGSILIINKDGNRISQYYDLMDKKIKSLSNLNKYEVFKTKLNAAVESWMIADVPVGSFLSGGLDSSVLTAIMQKYSPYKIKTFTISFPGHAKDESLHASKVANYLNTEHHVFEISKNEPEKLNEIFYHLEEPINDPAIIPTYFLAEETKKEVKVVMSGEGSDEINMGYNKYRNLKKVFRGYKVNPTVKQLIKPFLKLNLPFYGKAIDYSNSTDTNKWNLLFASVQNPAVVDTLGIKPNFLNLKTLEIIRKKIEGNLLNEAGFIIQKHDMESWLTNDLLLKVDKMTMAHGLEARTPYLDKELVDYCISLNYDDKIRGKKTKFMLREYGGELLPKSIQVRKQHGFIFPLDGYFSQLGQYVNHILSENQELLIQHIETELFSEMIATEKINKLKWGCFVLIMCFNNLKN